MTADLHSFVGAFALDALDPVERDEFEFHLDSCDVCRQEAAELSATAARLGSVAEAQPSAAMRERVLDAVSRTPQNRPAVVSLQAHRSSRRTPTWLLAAAAATAVLGVGVGVQQYQENQDLESAQLAAAREDTMIAELLAAEDKVVRNAKTPSGLQVTVVTRPRSDQAVVTMSDIPQLSEDRTYQVWRIAGKQPDSAAVMSADDLGDGAVLMLIDAEDADAVAVTEEPAGGSKQPTTEPLVAVKLA